MWTQENVWEQQMPADQHFELSSFEISNRENCYWRLVDFGEMSHSGSSIGNTTQGCSCVRLFFNVSGPSGLIQQFRGDSCQSVRVKGAWNGCNCFKTGTETKTMQWYGLSGCDAEQSPKEHCSTKSLFILWLVPRLWQVWRLNITLNQTAQTEFIHTYNVLK